MVYNSLFITNLGIADLFHGGVDLVLVAINGHDIVGTSVSLKVA